MARKKITKPVEKAVQDLAFVEAEAQNIATAVQGDHLYIKVDLTKDFGPSKSGRTHIVASSRGWVNVEEAGTGVSLNVVTKNGANGRNK